MSNIVMVLLMMLMYAQGIVLGYIIWAPLTPFKQGLIDGMSLKFLWSRK